VAAARAARQEEDLQASASGGVELDEFGRDVNMAKRQEASQRRQRRAQRLQAHADKQAASQVCDSVAPLQGMVVPSHDPESITVRQRVIVAHNTQV
jgi:predicted outer membrane protein